MFLSRILSNRYLLLEQAGEGGAAGGQSSAGAGQSGSGANGGGDGGANGQAAGSSSGNNGGGGVDDPLFGKGGNSAPGDGGRAKGGVGDPGAANSGQSNQPGSNSVVIPDNWKDALPPEMKDDAALGIIKDVPALVKSYLNQQKMIGADKLPIPGKHATENDWKEAFHKLGNPRDIKEYNLDLDKEVEKVVDAEFLDKFKVQAHALGILPKQAKTMVEWFGKLNQEVWTKSEEANNAKIKSDLESLRKEWGQDWDAGMIRTKAAVTEFSTPEERKIMAEAGLGQQTWFLKMMERVGKTLAEDKVRKHTGEMTGSSLSPSAAQARIAEIMATAKHPYFDKNHENHQKAKAEMEDLYRQAHPKKST